MVLGDVANRAEVAAAPALAEPPKTGTDDLALPGWVEEFARLEARHPGTVLHTRVARTSLGGQDELFPENFDLVDHLVGNRSPLCGLAFPRAWLTALGVSFDESLEVCEDWDLLLRIAPFCG